MHNAVVMACCDALKNSGNVAAVLRFNFTCFPEETPVDDVDAALAVLRAEEGVACLALVGYSFGALAAAAYLAARGGSALKGPKQLASVTLVAPPVDAVALPPMVDALRSLRSAGLRLSFVAGDADEYCAERRLRRLVAEVSPPAAKWDLARGCTADASSAKSPERAASHVVDGDPGTRWTSAYADGQWLSVDLGRAQALSRVDVRWEAACAQSYALQGSPDGATWTTLASETGHEGWVSTLLPPGSKARWVRVYGEKRATSFGFSIWLLHVYSSEVGSGAPTLVLPRCSHFFRDPTHMSQMASFVARETAPS